MILTNRLWVTKAPSVERWPQVPTAGQSQNSRAPGVQEPLAAPPLLRHISLTGTRAGWFQGCFFLYVFSHSFYFFARTSSLVLHGRWRPCLQGELWSIWEWLLSFDYWSIAASQWHCGVGEDSWESLGQQGEQSSESLRKSTLNTHGRTMLKLRLQYFGHLCEQPTHWKRPRCWERLRAGGEGDDGGWDGWMAPPTQWTWTWANTRRWWGTGSPACCSAWGHTESDLTSWLKSSKLRSNAALCSGTESVWHSVFGTKAWGICSLYQWFLLHACHSQRTDFWSSSDLS